MTDNLHMVIVLERVIEDRIPDYSVYGLTSCQQCDHLVYVGHESGRKLMDPNVLPICLECAHDLVPADAKSQGNVNDALCPNCGGKHLP